MKKLAIVVAWLVSLVLVAGLAANAALKNQLTAVGVELANTQAMLGFNHMKRYRELESYLAKGCYAEALEKAKISKEQEMLLLSEFFEAHPDTSINEYVSDRDPELIEQLKTFETAYDVTWTEPKCRK